MAKEDTVYLGDVQVKRVATQEEPSSSQEKVNGTASAVTGVKRQLSLADMFSGSRGKGTSGESSSKKLKLSASSNSLASSKSSDGFKISGVQPKLNSIPFSVSSFQETLTEEQMKLLRLECESMGKSWLKLLKDEIKQPYFITLKNFLWDEGVRGPDEKLPTCKIYPAPRDIYAWSNTPLGKVKVVIIGQDPYHGKGQAHGLCFSVPKGVTVPPSLRNIYTELKAEYPEFEIPSHGNLSAWAANGVLLLNTCLTVRAGDAGSHSKKGWEKFTDKVIEVVDKYGGANLGGSDSNGIGRGVVFLAWGAWAAQRVAKLKKDKHLVLKSAHPSPFSVDKGFRGNNHFKLANDWLEKKYGADGKVDWCQLEAAKQEL